MRLRRPCEHARYDEHRYSPTDDRYFVTCPGGEFLPEDALVIEKDADGEWPENAAGRIGDTEVDRRASLWWRAIVRDGRKRLDALAAAGWGAGMSDSWDDEEHYWVLATFDRRGEGLQCAECGATEAELERQGI